LKGNTKVWGSWGNVWSGRTHRSIAAPAGCNSLVAHRGLAFYAVSLLWYMYKFAGTTLKQKGIAGTEFHQNHI